tara:strand:- start:72 stop:479 length:408 start_codon:yes stop_codon:yes gene_type:complete
LYQASLLWASLLIVASCGGSTPVGDGHDHDHDHDHDSGVHVVDLAGAAVDVRFEVEVREGKVVGGIPRFEVSIGDVVAVTVTSDVSDQLHLHVYDAMADVGPGVEADLVVRAEVPGVFEAELHGSGLRVFELEVS